MRSEQRQDGIRFFRESAGERDREARFRRRRLELEKSRDFQPEAVPGGDAIHDRLAEPDVVVDPRRNTLRAAQAYLRENQLWRAQWRDLRVRAGERDGEQGVQRSIPQLGSERDAFFSRLKFTVAVSSVLALTQLQITQ